MTNYGELLQGLVIMIIITEAKFKQNRTLMGDIKNALKKHCRFQRYLQKLNFGHFCVCEYPKQRSQGTTRSQ